MSNSVREFEAKHGIALPQDYVSYLERSAGRVERPLAAGVAALGGVRVSPLWDWHQPFMEPLERNFLSEPFDPRRTATSAPEDRFRGALRVVNLGCEDYVLLVVSGRYAGTLWLDRSSRPEFLPLTLPGLGNLTFGWLVGRAGGLWLRAAICLARDR